MQDDNSSKITMDNLRSAFDRPPGAAELVGLEIESATLRRATGRSAPYAGPHGIRQLLTCIGQAHDGEPVLEGDCLVGVRLPGGASVSVELGGSLEYSSPPERSVTALVRRTERTMTGLAAIADGLGLALVPNGYLPYETAENVNWVPKPRASIMRAYYSALGERGARAAAVMTLNISTQVTLDYLDADDLRAKLPMLVAAAPIAAAIFANSPVEAGAFSGMLTRRTYNWLLADPARGGLMAPALRADFSLDHFIDWALDLPMIFKAEGDGYRAAPRTPFRDLLRAGFEDGAAPTMQDWLSHLNQIWTDVRLRGNVELRSTDGPPYWAIPAVPAFWTGLTYHRPSLEAAWNLLRGYSARQYRACMADVIVHGLQARLGGQPVLELARELVRLARAGTAARVATGLEEPVALSYLAPIEAVVATGRTFAEELLRRWDEEFAHHPRTYVDAFAVPC